jgi:hypothetical protein
LPSAPNDAIVTPAGILARKAHNELYHLQIDQRSADAPMLLGAVEFASDQFAIPGKNRVRLGDARHLPKSLPAETFADLSQSCSFRIRQPHARRKKSFQDAVLCR